MDSHPYPDLEAAKKDNEASISLNEEIDRQSFCRYILKEKTVILSPISEFSFQFKFIEYQSPRSICFLHFEFVVLLFMCLFRSDFFHTSCISFSCTEKWVHDVNFLKWDALVRVKAALHSKTTMHNT